ncbi:hypothetical protein LPJ56_000881 [Coemansia sp. RSA 2599]|nr:hypothetical protein LPJ75_000478 [Coemansia sp. RSA 2598]KAJ1828782.1 hypothetical protein LPJ56_000881 [Coemansia sp. RSA 2599]
MQFFKASILAALVSVAAAQSVDWDASESLACAQSEWPAIKEAVDPQLKSMWAFLPPVVKSMMAQVGALNDDNTLSSTAPSAESITRIARESPAGVFSPYADQVVAKCLATYVPSSEQGQSSSSTDEEVQSSSSSSTDEEVQSSSSSLTDEEQGQSSSSTDAESQSSSTDEQGQSSSSTDEASSSETYTSSQPSYSTSSTTRKCIPRPTN